MNSIEKEFWLAAKQNDPDGWEEFIYQVKEEWEKDMNKSKKLKDSFDILCKQDKTLGITALTFYSQGYASAKLRDIEDAKK